MPSAACCRQSWRGRHAVYTVAALLVGVAAQNPEPEFLATHGGYSFYKVFIDPTLYPVNTPILDNIISSTCLGASRGVSPMAPCASSSPACKYYSAIHCKGTSEEGCAQPMLTTSLAMQCSSALDPACRLRGEGSLIGSNGGCLWAHMGQAWDNNGACGNCYCAANPAADCTYISTFCQKGSEYTVDGSIWPRCTRRNVAGVDTCTTVAPAGAVWPGSNMQHWAFCVGRSVCKCVHGKCDISSEQGNCRLGTCGPGWHGQLCNLRCDPSYCLNRNNPAVVPPANVIASGFNGVWTTLDNQCHCDCLPQYGPTGSGGPPGTQCADCIQPGQLNCQPYVGKYLASTTPADTIQRGVQFAVAIEARFVQNDQIDSSLTEVITVEKAPGGGNGDGGTLTVQTQNSQLNQGRVTMIMQFSDACDACYLTFKDTRGILQPLNFGPIRVTTSGTHLVSTTSPTAIGVDDTIIVRLQAVDGPVGQPGSVDVTSPGVVTASLQTTPNGGNGGGCSLTAGAASSLTQSLTAGKGEWRLKFGCACDACYIIFNDQSPTRTLPQYSYGPIKVASQARSLGCRTPAGGPCLTATLQLAGGVYSVFVRGLDTQGNLDQSATGTVTVSITGGNTNGATLQNAAGTKGMTQPLVSGEVQYDLSFTKACESCVLTAVSSNPSILPYTFPALRVVSNAVQLAVANTVPTSLNVGQTFEVLIQARDASGNLDTTWRGNVGASLLPNGGNGNGGQLLRSDGTGNLVQALVNGAGTFSLKFTASCASCILEFTDTSASNQRLNSVQLPAIFVGTNAVRMSLRIPAPTTVSLNQPFTLTVQTTDVLGNVDTSAGGLVSVSLRPNGGNGNGGDLTDPLGRSRDLQNGQASFSLSFSQACLACYLDVAHSSPNVPDLQVGPIRVTSTATRLLVVSVVPRKIAANTPFVLTVRAVDSSSNIDLSPRGAFAISADAQGNNGNGGTLGNAGGGLLQQTMIDGEVTWSPQFSAACQACTVVIRDLATNLGQVSTDAITVVTPVSKIVISPFTTLPTQVDVNQAVDIVLFAVDSDGNKALQSPALVTGSLAPNGGNGDGKPFQLAPVETQTVDGEASFVATFGGSCTACFIQFRQNSSRLSLVLPKIEVRTQGTRMLVSAVIGTVPRNQAVTIPIRVVDDSGNTDTSWTGRVTASVESMGSGTGKPLSNAGQSLTQVFSKGVATFRLSFGSTCSVCTVRFTDNSALLPVELITNVKVTTETAVVQMQQSPVGAATKRGEPFQMVVRALDSNNNVNTDDTSEVSLRLANGLVPIGGETKRLSNGVATFTVTLNEECPTPCTITPVYAQGQGGSDATGSAVTLSRHDNGVVSKEDSDDGTNPIVWVLVAIIALLLLAALAFCIYKLLSKPSPAKADKDISVDEEPMEEKQYEDPVPEEQPNPIEYVFPSSSPARGGDRPWMLDVDAMSPQQGIPLASQTPVYSPHAPIVSPEYG